MYDPFPRTSAHPLVDGHCATELALDLAMRAQQAHPEIKAFAGYLSSSPRARKKMKTPVLKAAKITHKDLAQQAITATAAPSTPSLLTTPHFLIDYTASNIQYAPKVAAALETSRASQIDAHGFTPPAGVHRVEGTLCVRAYGFAMAAGSYETARR